MTPDSTLQHGLGRPEFITFTGVDAWTDPAGLAQLGSEYPIEWGILFSTQRQGVDPRYPAREVIQRLVQELPLRWAAHLCGADARAVLEAGASPHDDLLAAHFQRCQINTADPGAQPALVAQWAQEVNVRAILQCRSSFPRVSATDMLFDASGGRGIVPTDWPTAVRTTFCGYAGGLSPENVAQALAVIGTRADKFWLDMESGVRDENDRFSLGKCRAVCEAVYGPPTKAAAGGAIRAREILRETREALQFANDSPGGPISDTIWMLHQPQTVFDAIDEAIEVLSEAAGEPAQSSGHPTAGAGARSTQGQLFPAVTLNARQVRTVLTFAHPDEADLDQEETEISIGWRPAGKDSDGADAPEGYYVWLADYPQEGALYLDPDHGDLRPAAAAPALVVSPSLQTRMLEELRNVVRQAESNPFLAAGMLVEHHSNIRAVIADADAHAEAAPAVETDQPLAPAECAVLDRILEGFADCGQTEESHATLLDFTRRGYLECERFAPTDKAHQALQEWRASTRPLIRAEES